MIMFRRYFNYFEISANYTPVSKILFIIAFFLEFYPVSCIFYFLCLKLKHHFLSNKVGAYKTFFNISLVNYFRDFLGMENKRHYNDIIFLCLVLIVIILFLLFVFFSDSSFDSKKKYHENHNAISSNSIKKIFSKTFFIIFAFFIDVFFCRIFSFWIFFGCCHVMINPVGGTGNNYANVIFGVFVFVLYFVFLFFYLNVTFVYLKFDKASRNYPYDEFSSNYDKTTLMIKLCLAIGLNSNDFLSISEVWLFCIIFILFILVYYIIKQISLLLIHDDYILFFRNNLQNSLRFALLLFNTIAGIFLVSFGISTSSIVISLNYIIALAFSVIVSYKISVYQYDKIVKGGSVFNRCFILIDKYTTGSEKYIENLITNTCIYHTNHCKEDLDKCDICKECSTKSNEKINALKYISLFFNYGLKKKKNLYSKLKKKIISTFIIINETNSNCYLLNKFYSKTILKLFQDYPVLAMNVMCYFNQVLVEKSNDVEYVTQTLMIKLFLNCLEQILDSRTTTPESIILSAENLYKFKNMISKKLMKKIENKVDYQLIIMKYVYETSLNKKSNFTNSFFNFAFFDELLNDHFSNDSFFLLNFYFSKKRINILRATKDFSSYTGTQFKSLFIFGEIAIRFLKQGFKQKIADQKKERAIFEFPIKDTKNNGYITAFKMNYKIYPTIDLEHFLIGGFYQTKYSHVILTVYDVTVSEEKIISFSHSLSEDFIISPLIIRNLNLAEKFILFSDVFTQKEDKKEEDKKEKEKDIYFFDYKKYIPIVCERINSYFDSNKQLIDQEHERENYMIAIQKIKNQALSVKKEIVLNSIKKFYPKSDNGNFINVYYFQKRNVGYKPSLHKEVTSYLDPKYSEKNLKLFTTLASSRKGTNDNYISKSSATIGGHSFSSGKRNTQASYEIYQNYQNNQKSKRKSFHQFSFFTILILIYNCLLVICTIIFLGLEVKANSAFQKSFSFFQVWNRFYRLFFNLTISLFFNYCPAKYQENSCYNMFSTYGAEFQKEDSSHKLTLKRYAFEEFQTKVSLYPNLVSLVKNSAYEKNDNNMIKLLEEEVEYAFIKFENGKIQIASQKITYLNSLSVYFTLMNNIADEKNFQEIPIQAFYFYPNGTMDFSGIINVEGNTAKTDAYNIILNYRRFVQRNVDMAKSIVDVLNSDIDYAKFIGIFFLSFLIGNHGILILICFCVVSIFRKLLVKHCEDLIEKLSNMILTRGVKEKIKILKELSMFYSENPNTLSASYEKLKSTVKMSTKVGEKENDQLLLNINIELKNSLNFSKKKFSKVLRPTLNVIFSVFSLYLVFSIIYFVVMLWSLNVYSSLIDTFNIHSFIDAGIYSMFSIFQVMIYTNQTDAQMLTLYKLEEDEIGYINYQTKKVFEYLFYLEKEEGPHQNEITPIRNIINLNCSSLYFNLPERVITIMNTKYKEEFNNEDVLFNFLSRICSYFEFTKYGNDKIWINEILYRMSNLNDQLENSLAGIYKVNSSKEMFELYLIILFIFRPVRNYESTTIFLRFINDVTLNYNIVIYSYLILNTLFEIGIFWILRRLVITKYINTNKSMLLLSKCIKI